MEPSSRYIDPVDATGPDVDIGRVDVQDDEVDLDVERENNSAIGMASTLPTNGAEEDVETDNGDIAFSPTHSRQSSRRFSRISYEAAAHSRSSSTTSTALPPIAPIVILSGRPEAGYSEGDMGDMLGNETGDLHGAVPELLHMQTTKKLRDAKQTLVPSNSTVAALKKRFEEQQAITSRAAHNGATVKSGGSISNLSAGQSNSSPVNPSEQQGSSSPAVPPSGTELASNPSSTPEDEEVSRKRKEWRGIHHRIDSVPPQRYEFAAGESIVPHSPVLAAQDLNDSFALSVASDLAEDEYYDGPADNSVEHTNPPPSESPTQFEEITLDIQAPDAEPSSSRSPYGGGSRFARSSVEIRQDSIESGTWSARKARKAAASVGASDRIKLVLDLDQAESSSAVMRRASASELHRATRVQASDGSSASSTDVPLTDSQEPNDQRQRRRSAAGRYRGRRSEPPSRSGSPTTPFRNVEPYQPPVPSNLRTPRPGSETIGGVSMVVAGEDGELQVISAPAALPPPAPISTEGVTPSEKKHFTTVDPREAAASAAAVASSLQEGIQETRTELSDAADRPQKRQSKAYAQDTQTSLTRMAHLPPKERKEETLHLRTFEEMMKQSKALERQREEEELARKLQRDDELLDTTRRWNEEILPSWTRARKEPELRTLWWQGTPPSLRPRVWALAVGNAQMLPRNLLQLASKAVSDSPDSISSSDIDNLERDIQDTLPSLKLYQRHTGPLWEDLRDVLVAFVMVRLDQLKERDEPTRTATPPRVYEMGAASLAGMLLTNLSPAETLVALINLIAERPWLQLLYSLKPVKAELAVLSQASFPPSQEVIERAAAARAEVAASNQRAHERVFETLVADQMPKVYAILFQHGVKAAAFATKWVGRLFTPLLHFDTVARVWDVILLEEGDAVLFRVALALMQILEARLWIPDNRELTSILVGNNRAALSVWHRALDGEGGSAGGVKREVALASLGSPKTPRADMQSSGKVASSDERDGVSDTEETELAEEISESSTAAASSEAHQTNSIAIKSVRSSIASSSIEADPSMVPLDNIYAQYGITEARLFRELEEQRKWWKDSTLERLMNRELGA